jgi:hypothetical protein
MNIAANLGKPVLVLRRQLARRFKCTNKLNVHGSGHASGGLHDRDVHDMDTSYVYLCSMGLLDCQACTAWACKNMTFILSNNTACQFKKKKSIFVVHLLLLGLGSL